MAQDSFKREPIDWDAMELEAFNLKYERMSSKERLRKARKLANTYLAHNRPLPAGLDCVKHDLFTPVTRHADEDLEDSPSSDEPADTAALA